MKLFTAHASRLLLSAIALLMMTALATTSWGQTGTLKLEENFSYTAGTLLSANGWSSHSGTGTNNQTVSTAGLTYAGYASSGIGLADTILSTGDDENKTFGVFPSGLASGSIYYSALVNLSSAQIATGNLGDYFLNLFKNGTTFGARLHARRKSGDATKFSFGIAKSSTAANVAYSDSIYSIGTTYLVVVKYKIVAGATNDTVYLFVNPALGGSEPAPTVAELTADIATADLDTTYGIAVRQGGATTGPTGRVDGIRLGTTWQDVTASPAAPTVTTDPATPPTGTTTTRTLNGTVNANWLSTTVTFEYGTTTGYGTTVTADQSPLIWSISTAVSKALTGLTPNQTYHFRVKGVNSLGTTNGLDATFATSPSAPTATAASSVSQTGFTANWTDPDVNPPLSYQLDVATDAAFASMISGSPFTGILTTSFAVTGLSSSTTYFYRVRAVAASHTSASSNTITQTTTCASVPSQSSDIITLGTEPTTVSSLMNDAGPLTSSSGTQVWEFRIRDGGSSTDTDHVPTQLLSLTLTQDALNEVPDWSAALLAADLFLDSTSTPRLSGGVIGATSITFTGFTATAKDDSVKSLILRLSLKKPLPAGSDNKHFGFKITNANVTGGQLCTTSQFGSFAPVSSDVTLNKIVVIATRFAFTTQPPSTAVSRINIATAVSGTDANKNIDLDYSGSVTLARALGTGGFYTPSGGSTLTHATASGTASWSDLRYNKAEAGVTLFAAGSLTNDTTNAITFTPFTNNQSDVVTNVGESATISSLVNNSSPLTIATGVQVWDLKIRDAGTAAPDSDALPTLLTALTLTQDTSNTVPNWSTALLAADLFLDSTSTPRLSGGVIGSTSITFTGFTARAKDDSVKSLILRLSLRNPLPVGSDGKKFGFAVLPSNVTAAGSATSSLFDGGAAIARSDNTKNVIDVTATKLLFVGTVPSGAPNTAFSATAGATDANGNIDLGFGSNITFSKASGPGILTGNAPVTPTLGVGTSSTLAIDSSGVYTLSANATGVTLATSNSFVISGPATFKVAAGPSNIPRTEGPLSPLAVDTLAWDATATWTVVRGGSVTGIPHSRDSVILDHQFRATAYTIRCGPVISDSCAQITIGYPGNVVPVAILIPHNNVLPSASAALWFGDGKTGNYDMVIAEGGTVYDNKDLFSANVRFNSLNDSMKIRAGGLWYHNSTAFNTMHRILSRAIDGDYGTIEFDVNAANGIFDMSGGGNYYYPNIVFSNTVGAPTYFWFGTGATTIHGNVTVNPGAKDSMMLGADPFLVMGNIVNNGTIVATTSPLVFAGTTTQSVSGNPMSLGNGFIMMNPSGVNLLSNVNVTGGTVQTTGTFSYDSTGAGGFVTRTASGTVNTGTSTVFLDPNGSMNEGTNPVQGNVSATRTAVQGSNQAFGSIGYEINAAGGAPGSTTILRKTGAGSTSTGNGHQSIKRYFDVTPTNNTSMNATIGFSYSPTELNGIVETALLLEKSTNTGTTWTGQNGVVNLGTHKITATGVNSFSRWTAASVDSPMFVTHTITIRKYADADGDFGTAGDETLKKWRFSLYKDSVVSADSIAGGTPISGVLTVPNLGAGTYIAVEADSTSTGWTRLGKVHHGVRVATTTRYDTITVSGGVADSVSFINYYNAGFLPNTITVRKFQDNDGNFGTTDDRTAKTWYIEVRDTGGTLLGSAHDTTLVVTGLFSNEYVVSEADSTGWIHLGYVLNGTPVSGTGNSATFSLSGGQTATVDFVNASPLYSTMYRSFRPDSIANDKDDKGKTGKFVKRKANKVDFVARLIDDAGTVSGLHMEFNNAILLNYPFFTTPASTHVSPDGKNKKWDFTFTSPVHTGDTVFVHGFGNKGKVEKVGKYYWENGTTLVGTKKKDPLFTTNQPRLPMPNRVNALFETFAQTGFGANGLLIGRDRTADSAKQYGWILAPKYSDAQKSLKDKTGLHTGAAKGFDKFTSGKVIVKRQKSIPPAKQNNMLIADMIALKLNIAASTLLKTPLGFGELLYDDGTSNPYNGLMVKEIAGKADTLMMGTYVAGTHVFASAGTFLTLDSTIQNINRSFEGAVDTLDFAVKLHMKGTKKLGDVAYLHANPDVVPAMLIPLDQPIVEVPQAYKLYQNYPNPFNPTTTIQFDLIDQAVVTLKIYNILGQEVVTLLDHAMLEDGQQEVAFDAGRLASGVYFYRLITESVANPDEGIESQHFMSAKKMLLIK